MTATACACVSRVQNLLQNDDGSATLDQSSSRNTPFEPHQGNHSYRPTDLTNQAQAETELGVVANEYMTRGEMLPSEVVLSLVIKRLEQRDCVQNGWILDGKT